MPDQKTLPGPRRIALLGLLTSAIIVIGCSADTTTSAEAAQQDADADAQETAPQRQFPPKPQFPTMELQAQYQGPFEDTIIQRWRDPVDGNVCYLYIPAQVSREPREDSPFLNYAGNAIGSISCTAQPIRLTPRPGDQQPAQPQLEGNEPPQQ